MTRQEYADILNEIGIPIRYDHAETGLAVPFIYYTFTLQSSLIADNHVYSTKHIVELNLVTVSKAEQDEWLEKIVKVLDANSIPWSVSGEGWDENEKIYLITLTMEV